MTDYSPKPHTAARNKPLILFAICFIAIVILSSISPLLGITTENGTERTDNSADVERGKLLFEKRCVGCHSLDEDREGPRLRNVYGRKAGTVPTFRYSDALKSARMTWNDALLDKWLTNPDSLVPDTDMEFHVPKPEERAAIIRYLRVSSGK
jgi:cytochrome c